MPSSDIDSSLLWLYSAALDDLYRRFDVIEMEIRHIESVSNFYAARSIMHEASPYGLIAECTTLARGMLKELEIDKKNLIDYIQKRRRPERRIKADRMDDIEKASDGRFFQENLIYQAHFRSRARDYIAQIGHLNNSLGQRLEGFLLEDPAPTVRRAIEQEFTGDFLRRLTQNVYRDMNYFVNEFLHCEPLGKMPPTIQFSSFEETYLASMYRPRPADDANAHNAIVMSFWNIDFCEQYSILAHEMAHVLIEDIAGDLNILSIGDTRKFGILGKLGRLLSIVCDSWIQDMKPHYRLDIEVMADVLATAQFGFAYLYAWIMEMLNSDFELRSLRDDRNHLFDYNELITHRPSIAETVCQFRPYPSDMIVYLRGRAIAEILKSSDIEKDSREKFLLRALEDHLDHILRLRCLESLGESDFLLWQTIGNQIGKCIRKSGIIPAIGRFNTAKRARRKHGPFHDTAEERWFLKEQMLSRNVVSFLRKQRGLDIQGDNYHPLDIPWRMVFSPTHNVISEDCIKNEMPARRRILHTIQADYIYKAINTSYPHIHNLIAKTKARSSSPSTKNNAAIAALEEQAVLGHMDDVDPQKLGDLLKSQRRQYAEIYRDEYGRTISWEWDPAILSNNMYVLDLILGASIKDIIETDEPTAVPVKTSTPAFIELREPNSDHLQGSRYSTDITFGRYDRFVFRDISNEFYGPPSYGKNNRYDARRRILRQINLQKIAVACQGAGSLAALCDMKAGNSPSDNPAVVVLVSLMDKGLRNHFMMFELARVMQKFLGDLVAQGHGPTLRFEAFASEGYEDFVLKLWLTPNVPELRSLLTLTKDIYDSEFVARTETIIAKIPHSTFSMDPKSRSIFISENDWKNIVDHGKWTTGYKNIGAKIGIRLRPEAKFDRFSKDLEKSFGECSAAFVAAYRDRCRQKNQKPDPDIESMGAGNLELTYETGRLDFLIRLKDPIDRIHSYIVFTLLRHCIAYRVNGDVARVHTQLNEILDFK